MTNPTAGDYAAKPELYFDRPRMEIQPLLPAFSRKVLDVGCGSGATLEWIASQGKSGSSYGVELFEDAGAQARGKGAHVVIGSIEDNPGMFAAEKFDLILFLDVLEHLRDPWRVINHLVANNLEAGGTVIASIPNMRYHYALLPLLFKGEWEYEKSGVLDRTHLRWFTRRTAERLISGAGLSIDRVLSNPVDVSPRQRMLNALTLGAFRDVLTQQYVISAVKRPS